MSTHQQLLAEIEAFLKRHDVRPTTFGLRAVNDAKLVANLRSGADVTTRTLDRVRTYMRSFEGNGGNHPSRRASARVAA